jgi:hypothetical protein
MYSLAMRRWFQTMMASMTGVGTPHMSAMSLKVTSPNGRSVSKNLCAITGA